MELGLTGRVALVTGPSEGIGKATAVSFAKEVTSVVLLPAPKPISRPSVREIEAEYRVPVLATATDVTAAQNVAVRQGGDRYSTSIYSRLLNAPERPRILGGN